MQYPRWATEPRRLLLARITAEYIGRSGWQIDLETGEVYHPGLEQRLNSLIRDWVAADRQQAAADWRAERQLLHVTSDRRYPPRGTFNAVSRDLFYQQQPPYYVVGIGVSGLTLRPFAKVRLASSWVALHVDLDNTLRKASKNARRKAIRYGRLTDTARRAIANAVKDYLSK